MTQDRLVDQAIGLAFGVGVSVLLAVGIEIYQEVGNATDAALLSQDFWVNVGLGVLVTVIRSTVSAIGTLAGMNLKGISSAGDDAGV